MKLLSILKKFPRAYWLDILPLGLALIFYLYLQVFLFPGAKESFLTQNKIEDQDQSEEVDEHDSNLLENTAWKIQFLIDQNGNTPLVEFYYGEMVAKYLNTITFLENNRFESSFPFFSDRNDTGFYTWQDGQVILSTLDGKETATLILAPVATVDKNLLIEDLSPYYYQEADSFLVFAEPDKKSMFPEDYSDGWVALVFMEVGE